MPTGAGRWPTQGPHRVDRTGQNLAGWSRWIAVEQGGFGSARAPELGRGPVGSGADEGVRWAAVLRLEACRRNGDRARLLRQRDTSQSPRKGVSPCPRSRGKGLSFAPGKGQEIGAGRPPRERWTRSFQEGASGSLGGSRRQSIRRNSRWIEGRFKDRPPGQNLRERGALEEGSSLNFRWAGRPLGTPFMGMKSPKKCGVKPWSKASKTLSWSQSRGCQFPEKGAYHTNMQNSGVLTDVFFYR